jgi:signal transduction histidine kinase
MKFFRDLSITTKLTLLVAQAGAIALVLSSIAFVANDAYLIRSSKVQQLSALAEVLGSNSTAALEFDDPATAKEILASLANQPSVEFAGLYDPSGRAFATYSREQGTPAPAAPKHFGHQFSKAGYLEVTDRIEHEGQVVGTILVRSSMSEIQDQVFRYVNIAAVVMIVSLGASILLSKRLQRMISLPVVRLAQAAARISSERDYSIRVSKTADDELGTLYDQFNAMLDEIQDGQAAIQRAADELEIKIDERTVELKLANKELSREIAERRRAEQQLESVHQQLMNSARRAGMAEIANGVLHNVGNVLNSINVSATLAHDRMRQSKVTEFIRAAELIEQHKDDLAAYLASDAKGKQLASFLQMLATHLADERTDILKELELLTAKVDHVKTIISTQQSYAGSLGVLETVDVCAILDDAMKLNSASLDRLKITVIRQYENLPRVRLDRQKVLQILINLINNAREAFADRPEQTDRRLILRTMVRDDKLQIHVSDNGLGIAAENLTRVFSHGFTTKPAGHGFGLHSSANAASEMGGSLVATSDGPGKGATFVLELPYEPAEVTV